eukprot:scaffold1327_cov135-Isochrysis_galbana.AAC.5
MGVLLGRCFGAAQNVGRFWCRWAQNHSQYVQPYEHVASAADNCHRRAERWATPHAIPRFAPRATFMRCGGCLVRFAMIKPFYVSGSTTTCPTSTHARSWSFKLEMLTFVGTLGPPTTICTCAA